MTIAPSGSSLSGITPCLLDYLPDELLSHVFLLGTSTFDHFLVARKQLPPKTSIDVQSNTPSSPSDVDIYQDIESTDEVVDPLYDCTFELLVSRVCRRWRDVALSSPALWTDIVFELHQPLARPLLYLQRAKGATLRISIDYGQKSPPSYWGPRRSGRNTARFRELADAISIILPHMSHCQSLKVVVPRRDFMSLTLDSLSRYPSAPMLEVLELSSFDVFRPNHRSSNRRPILFQGNAPKLRHVKLHGTSLDWARSSFLSGLRHLELSDLAHSDCPNFEDFAVLIRNSPELTSLELCYSGPAGKPDDWRPQPIALPSLKHLGIDHTDTDYISSLTATLAIPALETLEMNICPRQSNMDPTNLLLTLARPSQHLDKSLLANLQEFTLTAMPSCREKIVAQVYTAMPHVTLLRLNLNYISEAWFSCLVSETTDGLDRLPVALPRLCTFDTTGIDGIRVRKLAERRAAFGMPLTHVWMHENDDLGEEDHSWLQDNVPDFRILPVVYPSMENDTEEWL